MEKKKFAVAMETLYDVSYFLIHIRHLDVISYDSKTNLLGIYMFKVDNKNNITRRKICLKLKPKNKYARTTLSNGVLLSLLSLYVFFLILAFLLLALNILMTNGNVVRSF